ncbi:mucin-5AC-like [Brienomyrus brachyistius]|uniref:mucin-5AC-like n=1 Tax=Brienomyrus brachyistius TaxID=42636 RepID=UPI0020B18363|nr:mucin-5AC-like [Brienomyrus brachyistius]
MKTKVILVLCTVVLLTCGFPLEAAVSQPPLLSASLPVTGTTVPQPTVRPNQNLSLSNSSTAGEDLPPSDSAVRNNSTLSGEIPASGGPVSKDSDSGDAGLASGSPISNNSAPSAGGPPASDCPIRNNSTPSGGGVPVSCGPFSNDSDSSGAGLPAPNGAMTNNSAPCGDCPSASNGMNDSASSNTSKSPTSAPSSTLEYSVTHTATSASNSSVPFTSTLTNTTLTIGGVYPAVGTLPVSTHLNSAAPTSATSPLPASDPQPTPRSSESSPGLSTQTQLPRDGHSRLTVKDKEEDTHGLQPPLDPLLAGLVSVFILTAVIITLLLFLKFRRRNNQPEFRRLQDLPMDDMMEDAPLSMYSY